MAAAIAALTPFINHLLITAARLGLAGAAVGASLLNGLQSALLIATAAWHNRQCPRDARPWTGFTKEAFSNIPAYLAVAVPGTGMMVRGAAGPGAFCSSIRGRPCPPAPEGEARPRAARQRRQTRGRS